MAVFENKTLTIQSCSKNRFPIYKTITTLFEIFREAIAVLFL